MSVFITILFMLMFMGMTLSFFFHKKTINSVKNGEYFISKRDEPNPFKKHVKYIILSVRNGYVLYRDTESLIELTTDVDTFLLFYKPFKG